MQRKERMKEFLVNAVSVGPYFAMSSATVQGGNAEK
jgi:hypothetical protein